MAIPVAFISGAAAFSFYGMSNSLTTLATVGNASTDDTVASQDTRLWTAEQQSKHEFDIQNARTDAMMLRQQVEALQSRVIVATREKEEAMRQAEVALQEKASLELQARTASQRAAEPVGEPTTTASLTDMEARFAPIEPPPPAVQGMAVIEPQATPAPSDAQQAAPTPVPPANTSTSDMTAAVDRSSNSSTLSTELTPRRASDVADAMQRASGLSSLAGQARQDLEARLVRGECVSSSLAAAFGSTVPVVPLRDLIRGLDSDC